MSDELSEMENEESPEPTPGESTYPDIPTDPDHTIEIENREHIQALVQEHDLVLIFFYGEWCDYCDLVEPLIDEIAENTWMTVAAVNIEDNQEFAKSKEVDELPTYLYYKQGELQDRAQGAHDREWFEDWLPLGY